MNILIVSGFLGAGKTTFIKELIRRTRKNIVILENEYGETNLDSQELAKSGENVDVWDMLEGCVCCTMKDSFAKSIMTISASLQPDYLVVEPTGIGKLSNILDNISKTTYEKIRILPPVAIISPRSYFSHMAQYPEIYEDQIENAAYIIYSKCEQDEEALLTPISDEIHKLNPTAEIISNHYSFQNDAWWNHLLETENTEHKETSFSPALLSGEIKPDELTIKNVVLNNVGQLVVLLENMIRHVFGNIVRAKGVLLVDNHFVRFDVADELYSLKGEDSINESHCVFIGFDIKEADILSRFSSFEKPEPKHVNQKKHRNLFPKSL